MARNRYSDDEKQVLRLNTSILKRLFKYMLPHKKLFFKGLGLLILNVLVSLVWPRLTQWIIDAVLTDGGSFENSIPALLIVVASIALLLLLNVFLSAKRMYIITNLGHSSIYDIRKELFEHIQTLAFKYFDDRPAGKIMVRVTSYIDSLATLLSESLIQLIVDVFTLVSIVVILLTTNLTLSLISFAALIPLCVFAILLRQLITKFYRAVLTKSSNRTAYINENIMGVMVSQAFNRQEANVFELKRLDAETNKPYYKFAFSASTLGPVVDILSTIGTLCVYFVAIGYIDQGVLSLGALTAFCAYMTRFWQPISSFVGIFNQFCEATGNIERIFETMDTEAEIKDAPDAYELPCIKGKIDYENVSFSYDGETNVLENVSFSVAPGEMIALVGPTGAGKTTVVNLLSRFYDVTAGSIKIDGHDVRNVTTRSLRTQVGVMMQDSFVFSGTIMDNIRYGRPDATDEECIAAAKQVYAAEFIEALPKQYNTVVSERGAGLSTGERQLLSFARAVLANPKVLILDEATSSIDTKTELLIQKALDTLLEGRTSFVIAHRLSTIKRADKIMCIAHKGIAEEGTHQELMDKKGIYYELNMSQYNALINK